jgi:CheY-like chemotaxis protein
LASLSDCITIGNTAAPESAWPFASVSSNAMEDESGSNPNQGKEPLSTSPSRNTPDPQAQRRFNLLLAEDNLPDVLLVREAIANENLPFDIFTASDGQQAFDFIERADKELDSPCPHFLLLDLNLPKKDGFEVLRRVRVSTRCRNTRVVVITSSDAPGDRKQAELLGAAYFRKPTSYEEFLKLGGVLKRLLEAIPGAN